MMSLSPSFNVHPIKPSKRLNVILPRRTANSRNRAKNMHSFGEGGLKESHKWDETKVINVFQEGFLQSGEGNRNNRHSKATAGRLFLHRNPSDDFFDVKWKLFFFGNCYLDTSRMLE